MPGLLLLVLLKARSGRWGLRGRRLERQLWSSLRLCQRRPRLHQAQHLRPRHQPQLLQLSLQSLMPHQQQLQLPPPPGLQLQRPRVQWSSASRSSTAQSSRSFCSWQLCSSAAFSDPLLSTHYLSPLRSHSYTPLILCSLLSAALASLESLYSFCILPLTSLPNRTRQLGSHHLRSLDAALHMGAKRKQRETGREDNFVSFIAVR